MKFVDSLSQSSINANLEKERDNQVCLAISRFIDDLEIGIKTETTKAAQNSKRTISGYVVLFNGGYSGDPYIGFVDKWEDSDQYIYANDEHSSCINIYRIDRVAGGKIETRYAGISYNGWNFITLSDGQIIDFQTKIENMLINLGFTRFKVSVLSKQFYNTQKNTTHGLFGMKRNVIKYDDGIGKVLYIELCW